MALIRGANKLFMETILSKLFLLNSEKEFERVWRFDNKIGLN